MSLSAAPKKTGCCMSYASLGTTDEANSQCILTIFNIKHTFIIFSTNATGRCLNFVPSYGGSKSSA